LVPSVPAALCTGGLPAGISVDQTRQFRSDSLRNYELGAKTKWLDHRLTENAAAFFVDWKNIQQWILLGCGFLYRANAGAARTRGGELEVNARPWTQPVWTGDRGFAVDGKNLANEHADLGDTRWAEEVHLFGRVPRNGIPGV
jgi:iron complex outermembrane recepter protein